MKREPNWKKIDRLILDRLNPEPKPMDLDDFASYRVSQKDSKTLTLRHHGCSEHFIESIELQPPFSETNVKWLMLRATVHHQEVHQQGATSGLSSSNQDG